MSFFHPRKIRTILHCSMYIYLESSSRLWPEKQWYPQLSIHQWPSVRLENATRKKLGAAHESLLKVGRFRFLKNHDSDSLAHFGGIGTRIGVKGIVKGIKKESFSDYQFLISPTGSRNHDSWCLILRNRATSIKEPLPPILRGKRYRPPGDI